MPAMGRSTGFRLEARAVMSDRRESRDCLDRPDLRVRLGRKVRPARSDQQELVGPRALRDRKADPAPPGLPARPALPGRMALPVLKARSVPPALRDRPVRPAQRVLRAHRVAPAPSVRRERPVLRE